jgi:AbrB family looped-hinge helix DNA binding protein
MPPKKKVDAKALIKAVESGTTRTEIMAQFGFSNRSQVSTRYLDALVEAGRAKGITSRQPKAASAGNTVKITKRGSISVPKEMVAEMGFKEGDSFTVRKTRAGLILMTSNT